MPSSIGAECVAKVIKIGKNVKKFINDIVIPLTRNNWVEKIKIDEVNLIKVHKDADLLQASMLKVNPASAYLMLNNYIQLKKTILLCKMQRIQELEIILFNLHLYKIKTINLVRRKEVIPSLKKIGAKEILVDSKKEFKL